MLYHLDQWLLTRGPRSTGDRARDINLIRKILFCKMHILLCKFYKFIFVYIPSTKTLCQSTTFFVKKMNLSFIFVSFLTKKKRRFCFKSILYFLHKKTIIWKKSKLQINMSYIFTTNILMKCDSFVEKNEISNNF